MTAAPRPRVARPTVAWYIHHHGFGHLTRFSAIRPHLDADVVVLSSLPEPAELPPDTEWIALQRDDEVEDDRDLTFQDPVPRSPALRDPAGSDPTAGGALHWAPLGHRGHRGRMAVIAHTLAEHRAAAMVVDVSVEVTTLARILGVPTVVMAQPGLRDDSPHALGRALSTHVIAPWASGLHGILPTATLEVGGISRFDGRRRTTEPIPGTVLVLGDLGDTPLPGFGGQHDMDETGMSWTFAGNGAGDWVDDPWDLLCRAEVVVSAAGQNSIADLAAVGARAIVIPHDRPFGEQHATARILSAHGLAVVPETLRSSNDWGDLIHRARRVNPRWKVWGTEGAALRAAAEIARAAGLAVAGTASEVADENAAAGRGAAAIVPGIPAEHGGLAVVTVFSRTRLAHVAAQAMTLRGSTTRHIGVWLDADPPPEMPGMVLLHVPPGLHGLRLAAARNAGANEAARSNAAVIVFLDADCVPGPRLLERYRAAANRHPNAVLCGPVTYLGERQCDLSPEALDLATAPHAARPSPRDGELQVASADEYRLFWSLSFALTPAVWQAVGGFDERYEGYGAEDTDFARSARDRAVPMVWVGGAHAYHQWHPTTSPPWAHLDDILRNVALFHDRWGETPMEGWLEAFADAGAIECRDGHWMRVPGGLRHAGRG